ncbi:MAG: anthranilate synthase component I family protein [Flavicella sp.]
MNRTTRVFPLKKDTLFKTKALHWAQKYETNLWLDSNENDDKYGKFEGILAVGAHAVLSCTAKDSFQKLKQFRKSTNDCIFGYLGYDLKNDVENLQSQNDDQLFFPDLYFFQPQKILFFTKDKVRFEYLNSIQTEIEMDYESISNFSETQTPSKTPEVHIQSKIEKKEYVDKVKQLLNHIQKGRLYEANFCQEFYAQNAQITPLEVYKKLNNISSPPFACFGKIKDKYIVSASPERYLQKNKNTVRSQPIKGTAKRSEDLALDQALKKSLMEDPKERAENIMIVDLVRNDLSRLSEKGSVHVEELCEVYSFKQVHQMISTISSTVDLKMDEVNLIKNTFPMGSMTGAPKVSAMEIIEELEETKRGLYSGAIGYITKEGDFDFNVVIRSILYNATQQYLSFSVGSAITAMSDPEKEYDECLLKAKAMRKVLTKTYE